MFCAIMVQLPVTGYVRSHIGEGVRGQQHVCLFTDLSGDKKRVQTFRFHGWQTHCISLMTVRLPVYGKQDASTADRRLFLLELILHLFYEVGAYLFDERLELFRIPPVLVTFDEISRLHQ